MTRAIRASTGGSSQFVELIDAKEADFRGQVTAPVRLDDVLIRCWRICGGRMRGWRRCISSIARAFDDASHAKARALVFACMADASSLLRDLVYTAWLDSATPLRARPPAAAAAAANTAAASAPATMPIQPMDPKHPRYTPATGSAPAERAAATPPEGERPR